MTSIYARLNNKREIKFCKLLSVEDNIYNNINISKDVIYEYNSETILDKCEWYFIKNFSNQCYAKNFSLQSIADLDLDSVERGDFKNIDYLFIRENGKIYFQNITPSKIVSKRNILCVGNNFQYEEGSQRICVNDIPDAIYNVKTDIFYFKRIEAVTKIFDGMSDLYFEATDEDTAQFLNSEFLELGNGYSTEKVKKENRKRIAIAQNTLKDLDKDDIKKMFIYISEYCQDIKSTNNKFLIQNENDLKLVLYGIQQRFYTTVVGNQKRIANSVVNI